MAATEPPDYAWLREPKGRMGSLRMIGTAVRRRYLDGPEHGHRRAALVAALYDLLRDPTATGDEVMMVARIVLWMEGARPFCRLLPRGDLR